MPTCRPDVYVHRFPVPPAHIPHWLLMFVHWFQVPITLRSGLRAKLSSSEAPPVASPVTFASLPACAATSWRCCVRAGVVSSSMVQIFSNSVCIIKER